MCASYGLTSERRRRSKAERMEREDALFKLDAEPEFFNEKVDARLIPASLEQWLDEHDDEGPL